MNQCFIQILIFYHWLLKLFYRNVTHVNSQNGTQNKKTYIVTAPFSLEIF